MLQTQVTDTLMQVVWLFENTLWKYSNDVAYNQDKEQIKRVLDACYWYKNIYNFVKPELDEESVDRFFKTVFSYYEHKEVWQTK